MIGTNVNFHKEFERKLSAFIFIFSYNMELLANFILKKLIANNVPFVSM
jgi:hypothetical protein